MPRKRNKYSRARIRAKVRRPRKRGGANWFYGVLSVIVIGGILLVAVVREGQGPNDVPPRPTNSATGEVGDHWHEAFGVNICGQWLSYPAEFTTVHDNPNVYAGLHTHADGFIHVEPASLSESGNNATVGKFLDYAGWTYSDDAIDMWEGPATDPSKTRWENGDECPAGSEFAGQTGVVSWERNCKARTSDLNKYKVRDLEVIAIGFLPKGEAIGPPESADDTPVPGEGQTFDQFDVKGCSTVGPGGSTTTTSSPGGTTTTSPPQ
jgi:hypothetical protein